MDSNKRVPDQRTPDTEPSQEDFAPIISSSEVAPDNRTEVPQNRSNDSSPDRNTVTRRTERRFLRDFETVGAITAGATIIIMLANLCYVHYSDGQLSVMRRQLDMAEKQWRSQQVPWLGLEDNTITMSPSVTFNWPPADPTAAQTIMLNATYYVRNSGSAPAFYETDSLEARIDGNGDRPIKEWRESCSHTTDLSNLGSKRSGIGEVILPGARKRADRWAYLHVNEVKTPIIRVWIFVCVAYIDSWKHFRQSRYLFLAHHALPMPGRQRLAHLPIAGTTLISAETEEQDQD